MKFILMTFMLIGTIKCFSQNQKLYPKNNKISKTLKIDARSIDSIAPLIINKITLTGIYKVVFEENDEKTERNILYIEKKVYFNIPYQGRKFNKIDKKLKKYFSQTELDKLYKITPFESIPNI